MGGLGGAVSKYGPMLRVPLTRRLLAVQTLNGFGSACTVGLIAILISLHRQWTALSVLYGIDGVTSLVLGIFAGVIADRHDRRGLMIASALVRALAILVLVIHPDAHVVVFLLAMAVTSVMAEFSGPASASLITQILAPEDYYHWNALKQTLGQLAGCAGMAIAGLLVPRGLERAGFAIDMLSYLVYAAVLVGLPFPDRPQGENDATPQGLWRDTVAGLKLVGTNRVLRSATTALAIYALGAGLINVAFTPWVVDDLHVPATWIGLLAVVLTVGGILGAALPARATTGRAGTWLLRCGLLVIGILSCSLTLVRNIYLASAILLVFGILATPTTSLVSSLLQAASPPTFVARIFGALGTASQAGTILGTMAAGLVCAHAAPRACFLAGGLIVIVGSLALLRAVSGPSVPREEATEAGTPDG